MGPKGSLSAKTRTVLGTILAVSAFFLLVGGWTIPFVFESFSILYKFGLEKIYLRSGKIVGITITELIFFQMVLASRFAIFKQVFSAKRHLTLHRVNGMVIAVLAGAHPLLIKASENFTPYTWDKKYYPEFLGIGLLVVLLLLSFTAIIRNLVKIPYRRWLLQHRLAASLVVLLMPTHILFVSDTFKTGLPRRAAVIIIGLNLLMLLGVWLRSLQRRNR